MQAHHQDKREGLDPGRQARARRHDSRLLEAGVQRHQLMGDTPWIKTPVEIGDRAQAEGGCERIETRATRAMSQERDSGSCDGLLGSPYCAPVPPWARGRVCQGNKPPVSFSK